MNDTPTKPSIIYVNFSTEYGIMGIEFNLNAKAARSTRIQAMLLRVHYSQLGKTENRCRLTSFRTVILFGHRCFTFLRARTIIVRLDTHIHLVHTCPRHIDCPWYSWLPGPYSYSRNSSPSQPAYSRLAHWDSRHSPLHTHLSCWHLSDAHSLFLVQLAPRALLVLAQ